MIQKAEAVFIKQCREGDLKSNYLPSRIVKETTDPAYSSFSAAERFLLDMMGESHTIQT